MNTLLQFSSIWEYMLRYTVIVGIVICIIGTACCFVAKMFNNREDGNNHSALLTIGVVLILLGMIVMVLPIEATLYRG